MRLELLPNVSMIWGKILDSSLCRNDNQNQTAPQRAHLRAGIHLEEKLTYAASDDLEARYGTTEISEE